MSAPQEFVIRASGADKAATKHLVARFPLAYRPDPRSDETANAPELKGSGEWVMGQMEQAEARPGTRGWVLLMWNLLLRQQCCCGICAGAGHCDAVLAAAPGAPTEAGTIMRLPCTGVVLPACCARQPAGNILHRTADHQSLWSPCLRLLQAAGPVGAGRAQPRPAAVCGAARGRPAGYGGRLLPTHEGGFTVRP